MTQCIALAVLIATAPPNGGTVRGRVVWAGDPPTAPALPAPIPDPAGYRMGFKPNPFAPRVKDGGLGGVVVSLGSLPPNRSESWQYPPVVVEQNDYELRVRQGDDGPPAAAGFVRAGDPVRFVSRDPGPATMRLRGAAYFTLPFPAPDRSLTRRLDIPGVVEVTSGTMLAWAACDLIVSDHPYHTLTRDDGTFELTDVPPGEYPLTVRVRNWQQVGHDRDPETGLVSRRRFGPPAVISATVRVPERGTVEHTFTVSITSFPPR